MLLEKKMNITNSVLDYTRHKQMNWRSHVKRIHEESRPRKILEWGTPGRRGKGRPRNSWIQEVTTTIREKCINNMEWIDKEEYRTKIKFQTHKYVGTLIFCTLFNVQYYVV